jgi:hypothetical protein
MGEAGAREIIGTNIHCYRYRYILATRGLSLLRREQPPEAAFFGRSNRLSFIVGEQMTDIFQPQAWRTVASFPFFATKTLLSRY